MGLWDERIWIGKMCVMMVNLKGINDQYVKIPGAKALTWPFGACGHSAGTGLRQRKMTFAGEYQQGKKKEFLSNLGG